MSITVTKDLQDLAEGIDVLSTAERLNRYEAEETEKWRKAMEEQRDRILQFEAMSRDKKFLAEHPEEE